MPIEQITIIVSPNPKHYAEGDKLPNNRSLTFNRSSKKWICNDDDGFFSGEIKLIDAINKVRNDYGDI